MKIFALVTDAFGGVGGIAQYNRDLLAALTAGGNTQVVVLPRRAGIDRGDQPEGIRQLAARPNKVSYGVAAVWTALAKRPFDAVFCGHLYLAPLAALIAWWLDLPLWLQLHGVEAWAPPSRAQRWAAERARVVTAVSRYTRRRFLQTCGVPSLCVRVLPNTFAASFAPGPKPAHLLDRYGLHRRQILLTVGRLAAAERQKGHDRIIAALPDLVRTHPDLVYVVAGVGDDRQRLEKAATQLGVGEHLRFIGGVSAQELPDHYRLADVFVMPSTQEGFGIVFLEAAASGLPLVGGNGDGSVDALADGDIGLMVDPNDKAGLVDAVRQALAGTGPDPAGVHRFAVQNFSRRVGELSVRLRSGTA